MKEIIEYVAVFLVVLGVIKVTLGLINMRRAKDGRKEE